MNKCITQTQIILTSCCLLLASTQLLADRPAMDERSEASEPFGSEVIDISTELEEVPEFEEISIFEKMPDQENRPTVEETSAIDDLPDLESRPGMEAPSSVDVEPNVQVYDHTIETESTGDVIELQAGDTLPVTVMDFPSRGMSMDKVKNELGPALSASAAIGDPPITTWTYNDRIVYFEHTHVIHVVAAH